MDQSPILLSIPIHWASWMQSYLGSIIGINYIHREQAFRQKGGSVLTICFQWLSWSFEAIRKDILRGWDHILLFWANRKLLTMHIYVSLPKDFFFSTGVQTQGLMHTKQVLYHWTTFLVPKWYLFILTIIQAPLDHKFISKLIVWTSEWIMDHVSYPRNRHLKQISKCGFKRLWIKSPPPSFLDRPCKVLCTVIWKSWQPGTWELTPANSF